ncbi:MAG TPA: C1 family peptidase [Thermoanaerobaculia bacterium]|nr:C1 family peptidase [Thermoanaerobaculia bacterium]
MADDERDLSRLRRRVVPDRLDLRDRPYLPAIGKAPMAFRMAPRLPVLDQGTTSACTGFALATVVHFLLRQRDAHDVAPEISPYMLYSMARRYDEFPGAAEDSGSSLRGTLRGWHKHGACRRSLWADEVMPPPAERAEDDWWQDAATRPLGAYYRVDTRSVTDMHVALEEVGILYASALCHRGWLAGFEARLPERGWWRIPPQPAEAADGGHAFAIVGYSEHGFLVQSSWGERWGSGGLAVLTYQDWLEHAMDCWVAQLGVVTREHEDVARHVSLRYRGRKVRLASDSTLRNRELSPFIVNMQNNGRLSQSGAFRTNPSDIEALVTLHTEVARKAWGLPADQPTDVAIYAHGGLTSEATAAETAAKWVPALYEAKVLPIFLMWETDLWATLENAFRALVGDVPRPTAGLADQLRRFWNQRLEGLLAPVGSRLWGEMKQNAKAITEEQARKDDEPDVDFERRQAGGVLLHQKATASPWFKPERIRLHLIGHSAGAIVHAYLIDRLVRLGWTFETVTFLAPALTVDLFARRVRPHVENRNVRRFETFHLSEPAEQQDPTCKPLFGYGRSLLWLVSQAFEPGTVPRTPLVGLERDWNTGLRPAFRAAELAHVKAHLAPGPTSASTTHGGFDDDPLTRASVIEIIRRSRRRG